MYPSKLPLADDPHLYTTAQIKGYIQIQGIKDALPVKGVLTISKPKRVKKK